MNTITIDKAKNMIYNTNGKIFKATFRKKDGRFRRMICRLGVKKYLKGGKIKYNPASKNLAVVFDFEKRNYRMINLATLMFLTIAKSQYKIKERG